jgi:TonB family protein
LPEWDSAKGPAPLSLQEAIDAGQAWLARHNGGATTWTTMATSLSRFIGGTGPSRGWYYRLVFVPRGTAASRGSSGNGATQSVVIVLLDGSVIEPTVKPAAPVLVSGTTDVYRAGDGVAEPVIVQPKNPKYTKEALRARVEGSVIVECIVNTNGRVSDAKVVKSLDAVYGLDDEAVKTVKEWRFKPGMLEGRPVRVAVTIGVEFSLRNQR